MDAIDEGRNIEDLKIEFAAYARRIQNNRIALGDVVGAQEALLRLKEILTKEKLKSPEGLIPERFVCPISGKIMNDPVRGQTRVVFDKISILNWFHDVHREYEQLRPVIASFSVIPEYALTKSIQKWCRKNLKLMFKRLASTCLTEKKEAAKRILSLAEESCVRANFKKQNIVSLFEILSHEDVNRNLREDIIKIIFNLASDASYQKLFSKMQLSTTILVQCLRIGSIESRTTVASIISSIVSNNLKSNGNKYGAAGVFRALVQLLRNKNVLVTRVAASLISKLCYRCVNNRRRAVQNGAIRAMKKMLSQNILVSELLALYVVLSARPIIASQLGGPKAAQVLLRILRNREISELDKENCLVVLRKMCKTVNRRVAKLVKKNEVRYGTISRLTGTGRKRAREEALRLLRLTGTL